MTREAILTLLFWRFDDGRRVAIRVEKVGFGNARVSVSWQTKGRRTRTASRTGPDERTARIAVLTSGEVPRWVRREIGCLIA